MDRYIMIIGNDSRNQNSAVDPEFNFTAAENASDCPYVYRRHQWLTAKLILMSVCGSIVAVFGIMANLTTAFVLTRPSMRSPNNLYLTTLAVFDTCILVTGILIYSIEYVIEYTENFEMYVAWLTYLRFCYAVGHISQTGSVYTTVGVTIERYLAVVHPSKGKRLCTKRGAAMTILVVTCFAILFNCTKFFEIEIERQTGCYRFSAYTLTAGTLMKSESYSLIYSLWVSNIVMVFLPFFTLAMFNAIISIKIRQNLNSVRWSRRGGKKSELKEKSREATIVSVIIVSIFLVCNFWGFVTTLLERIYGQTFLSKRMPKFYAFSREAINFLALVNASVNFVIYCIFGKDFRNELSVFCSCWCKVFYCCPFAQNRKPSALSAYDNVRWAKYLNDSLQKRNPDETDADKREQATLLNGSAKTEWCTIPAYTRLPSQSFDCIYSHSHLQNREEKLADGGRYLNVSRKLPTNFRSDFSSLISTPDKDGVSSTTIWL